MSQIPPDNAPQDPAAPNPALVVRRRASVNLRGESDASDAGMDPANRSLADALRVTYRILQFAMLALFGAFVLSGLQKIDENERGVRLRFGAIVDEDVPPGPAFALPRPLGEIVRVPRVAAIVRLDREFMPEFQQQGEENKTEAELAITGGKPDLNPERDGSLLTGDLNIAHVRFSVEYLVSEGKGGIREFIQHVRFNEPDPAKNNDGTLVGAAVRRGAIRAAAGLSIDELRRDLPDPNRSINTFQTLEIRTQQIAQETLDAMKTGIQIKSLKLDRRMVPVKLINDFNKVEQNLSDAKRLVEGANQERSAALAKAAGEAAPLLLKLIDLYDAQYSAGKTAEADATLAKIDALLEGREIELDGQKLAPRLSGDVAMKMSDAMQYRSSIVSKAQADAATFQAKLAAYKANPAVLLTGEWSDAVSTFLTRDLTQSYIVGADAPLQLWINRDPELLKALEKRRNEIRSIKIAQENAKLESESKFVPPKVEITPAN